MNIVYYNLFVSDIETGGRGRLSTSDGFTLWCCRFPEHSTAPRLAAARRPPGRWRRSPVRSSPSTTVWPCCPGPAGTRSLAATGVWAEARRLWPSTFSRPVYPPRCPAKDKNDKTTVLDDRCIGRGAVERTAQRYDRRDPCATGVSPDRG